MENQEFITKDKLKKLGFTENSHFEGLTTGVLTKNNVSIGQNGDDFRENKYSLVCGDKHCKVQTMADLHKYFPQLAGCDL